MSPYFLVLLTSWLSHSSPALGLEVVKFTEVLIEKETWSPQLMSSEAE